MKSALLYIIYLLLTVSSKAENYSFRGAIPKLHFAKTADCFLRMSEVYKQRSVISAEYIYSMFRSTV